MLIKWIKVKYHKLNVSEALIYDRIAITHSIVGRFSGSIDRHFVHKEMICVDMAAGKYFSIC
jgi:hypothetical protein